MQFQSDMTGVAIERPRELESTARGAAMLAGVGSGLFATMSEAAGMARPERTFTCSATADERARHRKLWREAVRRTMLHDT